MRRRYQGGQNPIEDQTETSLIAGRLRDGPELQLMPGGTPMCTQRRSSSSKSGISIQRMIIHVIETWALLCVPEAGVEFPSSLEGCLVSS